MSKTIIENLKDARWAIVRSSMFKAHACPSNMVAGVVSDIKSRGGDILEIRAQDSVVIDLPGMVMVDRPMEQVEIDGFTLAMPSQDFDWFLDELYRLAPERSFKDGTKYHKIHGWVVCFVMSPDQKARMLEKMERMLPDVMKRAGQADQDMERRVARMDRDKKRIVRPKPVLVKKDSN